jgi:hypothetical protein
MKEVCRELESEFGLRELSSNLPLERQTGAARRPEFEEARRLDVDVTATREIIRTCYDQSDNGPSFAAALAEHGLSLARGDRRDFVAIDGEGGQHALSKRICGATAEEIRGRLGEEFKRTLPTVDEARQQLEAQRETQQAATPQTARRSLTDRTEIASEVSALWAASDTGQSFAASLDERGYVLARGDRRDFVLIDSDGNHFALARLIDGARAADVRAKLNDIDAGSLPSVSEARAEVEARAAARKKPPEPVAQREAAPDVPAVSASRDAPDVSADATAGIEITPPDPTEIVDGAARGFSKILGAALGAVARSAEQLVGLLDGLTGGSKPEPQRGPPEPPPEAAHDSPPAPGQMPDPSANLTDEARNEAVARWLAQTQDEMRGGQDEKDRRARDDDEEYGIERPR